MSADTRRGAAGVDEAEPFDDGPGRAALAIVLVPGVVSALVLLTGGPAALAGALGLGLLAVGTHHGRRDLVGGGGLALLAGTLLAGAFGAGPAALLVAAGAGLVAWDTAEHAVGLGEQVGCRAATGRAVGVHAAGGGLLAASGGGLAYVVFRLVGGGSPVALVLLLGGAVALLSAIRS
ncbi:DUF7519 family protein [Haloglomus halophilum]|uniref:DUF7519 family protein n=1 Tax=Haloglomus halophilum TaxID=2962672 RepID=UPI0020C9DBA8|nr:hypothetical protein [Haloglomus halophilum]